jgi:hypothetical protein
MLKVILMLDCNMCGQPFDRVATSTDRDPLAWKPLACDLEYSAELRGWSFHRGAHYCDYCVSDVELASIAPATRATTGEEEEEPDF